MKMEDYFRIPITYTVESRKILSTKLSNFFIRSGGVMYLLALKLFIGNGFQQNTILQLWSFRKQM